MITFLKSADQESDLTKYLCPMWSPDACLKLNINMCISQWMVDGDREEWSWWKVNMMKGVRDDMGRGLFRCVPGCQLGWIIDVREKRIKKRGGREGWIDGRDKMFPSYCLSPPSSLFKNEHRTDNEVGGFLVVFFLAKFLK